MQEQIEREAIAIELKASKLTSTSLQKALESVLRFLQQKYHQSQTPRGRQSVKQLMNHNVATNTITIEGDSGLFDQVARKWNVDYAFHQTSENKYLLLFKSSQADAITAVFAEYTAEVLKRAKCQRPPFKEQYKEAEKEATKERSKKGRRKRERQHEAERG